MHSIYGEAQILCTKIKFFFSARSVSILLLVPLHHAQDGDFTKGDSCLMQYRLIRVP